MTTGKTIAHTENQIALMIFPKGKLGGNLFVFDLSSEELVQLTQEKEPIMPVGRPTVSEC